MGLERKFDIKTSVFRLPQGTSPTDSENVNLVKRILKSATGGENISVDFHRGPNGEILTDLYNVTIEFPTLLADGNYVSLAKRGALQGETANLIANIIKTLSEDGDAKSDIQKLLSIVTKGKGDEKEEPKEEGKEEKSEESGPSLPTKAPAAPSTTPPASPSPLGTGDKAKPRMPFAKRQSKLKRAILLEKRLNIPLKEGMKIAKVVSPGEFPGFVRRVEAVSKELGIDPMESANIVRLADTCNSFKEWHTKAQRLIRDENDKPFGAREYARLAKLAKEGKAPLA